MAKRLQYKFFGGYYFQGDIDDKSIQFMEHYLQKGVAEKIVDIIPGITLREKQTLAVALAYLNKRFMIGDKPGLGKTVMSSATYLLAKKKSIEAGNPMGKLLLVTNSAHLRAMTKEMSKYGINLAMLEGGTVEIKRDTKKLNLDEVDGISCSWRTLLTNGFNYFFMENIEAFENGMIIFDESSAVKNVKTKLHQTALELSGIVDRVLMLNGSPFETHIMDIFNQFTVLNPTVMPTKTYINNNYVVQGESEYFKSEMVRNPGGFYEMKRVRKTNFKVSGYKNQTELKDRLRYHMIARSKGDFATGELPDNIYTLVPVEMSSVQRAQFSGDWNNYNTILNSPMTRDKEAQFTFSNVPKFEKVVDLIESVIAEKPVVFVWHLESQNKIAEHLRELGYKVGQLNSKISADTKEKNIEAFNNGELDVFIINTFKAINLPNCNTMIFYNIPMNPQLTYQAMARIDRNNYDTSKTYYFLAYLGSPEVFNMRELALFREENANEFIGTEESVFKQLVNQLDNIDEEDFGGFSHEKVQHLYEDVSDDAEGRL